MATNDHGVSPKTGHNFRLGGCLISGKSSHFPKCGAANSLSNTKLPPSVDLRIFMTAVENQEDSNSCVANAIVGALEFLIKRNCKKHIDISRLFIYYNSRLKDGLSESNMKDSGTYIESAVAVLKEFGSCKESLYQYDLHNINKKPQQRCYSEAKNYRVTDAESLPVDLIEMKSCLAKGHPFAFGLHVYETFKKIGTDGLLPMPPSPHQVYFGDHGWHALLAVGYSDELKCFFVRNSYGEKWGDKGYCYIPYDYMCDPQFCRDLHCIKIVSNGSHRSHEIAPQKEEQQDNRQIKNRDNNKIVSVEKDNEDYQVDHKFFWNYNDTFDYIQKKWKDQRSQNYIWNNKQSNLINSYHSQIILRKNNYPMKYILWIDKNNDNAKHLANQLNNNFSLQIDFYDTLFEAQNHLSIHINKIRPSFQIIISDDYQNENKNPLNLLDFLDNHGLKYIPILIFTQNKNQLQSHLENNAQSIGIYNWKKRMIIIDNFEELLRKSQENINK